MGVTRARGRGLRVARAASGVLVISFDNHAGTREAFSEAEQLVVRLAVDGNSNTEIAELRGTSVRTVANQLARAYRKLGVTSRAEEAAVMLAS